MSKDHLTTYLNDHLAGSVAAIKLLEQLESHDDPEVSKFAAALKTEVEVDSKELESLMRRLDVSESSPRKAAAWFTEKFAELKLKWDDKSDGVLYLLESFEALSLGIEGKQVLWRALKFASDDAPALRAANYDNLIKRAEEQRKSVEAMRLSAAQKALNPQA